MKLFEDSKLYTPKEIMSTVNISRMTLMKCCENGLSFIRLPNSAHRRYIGEDLNNFFNKTK